MVRWERSRRQFVVGHTAFLGVWAVGSAFYATVRRGDPMCWEATCQLPGVAARLGRFKSEDEARASVERAVESWVAQSGLIENGG